MAVYRFLFIVFFISCCISFGHASMLSKYTVLSPPPVEKVSPPVEKKAKKKKRSRAKRKFLKKHKAKKAPNDLGNSALTFWLIFAILNILIIILGAFIIGLGLAPWSLAAWVMLGAEIANFLILMFVLWVDRPGDPAYVQFVFALIALALINLIIGLAFLIWGLATVWIFGWILGLVMILFAALLLGTHMILAHKNAKS